MPLWGASSALILEGGGTHSVAGQPDKASKEGDHYQIPAEVPHAFQNGGKKSRILVVYAVEKDKPLATPAPAGVP